jgi:O-methyltransferase involved in polyketide biosynthesis
MAHESKPSKTAMLVSQAVFFKSLDPIIKEYCISETSSIAEEVLRRFHPLRSIWTFLLTLSLIRTFCTEFENLTLPGFMNHVVLRKWWIARTSKNILKDHGHLVVIGAGLDGLAYHLALTKNIQCYEMDLPQTQNLKMQFISNTKVQFLEMNFEVLRKRIGTESVQPIVYLLEGVSMYLSEKEIKELFVKLAEINKSTVCYFIGSFMELNSYGIANFHGSSQSLGYWLKHVKEPFAWGINKDNLPQFMENCNWECLEIQETSDIAQKLGLPLKVARGEYLALARRK